MNDTLVLPCGTIKPAYIVTWLSVGLSRRRPGFDTRSGKMLFHLLHLAPTVNNPHVCTKKYSLNFISRDCRTPRNSGTNFNLEGENITGYRYMIHLYCLAVQAGLYSDVVECWPVTQTARV